MPFVPPPRGAGLGPGGPGFAEEKIAAEEQWADHENLVREIRRAQGGGPLRRALRRLGARFRTEDPPPPDR